MQSIIAYARIADVRRLPVAAIWRCYGQQACITKADFYRYFNGLKFGYVIVLDDVKALGASISAADLRLRFGFRAPQSYRYASTAYCELIA